MVESVEQVAPRSQRVLRQDDLERVRDLPLAEHADAYQRLHERLQEVLAAIDNA